MTLTLREHRFKILLRLRGAQGLVFALRRSASVANYLLLARSNSLDSVQWLHNHTVVPSCTPPTELQD